MAQKIIFSFVIHQEKLNLVAVVVIWLKNRYGYRSVYERIPALFLGLWGLVRGLLRNRDLLLPVN